MAASTLGAQLSALRVAQGPTERYVRGKASLLFDYGKAADVSAESLLALAQTGIEALSRADKRFAPLADALFSRSALLLSRDQLTSEQEAELDQRLGVLLRLLTGHFLAPAAFQVLEFCVRRYKVHVHNVSELLLCALPYHSTPEFARLVALLSLDGTPWAWLGPCQASGAPPPRELLVARCTSDHALLREIARGAQACAEAGLVCRAYLSFYGVLLCEVLCTAPAVSEELLTTLLPFLAKGLAAGAARDYRAATLMALSQLLARAQLSKDFLSVVSVEVVRGAGELGGSTALMLLAHLAATQPHMRALPARALKLLAEQQGQIGEQLKDLQKRRANVGPLIALLLSSVVATLPTHPGVLPLLRDMLATVTLPESVVQAAALGLLHSGAAALAAAARRQEGSGAAGKASPPDHLVAAMRELELRHPERLDAAINSALCAAQEGSTAAADGDCLFDFAQACFAGGAHEVVRADDGNGSVVATAQTLSLAAFAPASSMRAAALQRLDALCGSGGRAGTAEQELLSRSLLVGLQDESAEVASAAAGAAGLAGVEPEQLLPALAALLERCSRQLAAGAAEQPTPSIDGRGVDMVEPSPQSHGSGSGKQALRTARSALAAVAAAGARANSDSTRRQATALLLEHALGDKRSKRLARAAVAQMCATGPWHPLLKALAAAPGVTAALEAGAADGGAAAAPSTDGTDGSGSSKQLKKGRSSAAAAAAATTVQEKRSGLAAVGTQQGGKHAGALALNRAAVQAIAAALAEPGGADLLQELQRLSCIAGPRCLHLLTLALGASAGLLPAGSPADTADAAPPTPQGKPGRGAARGSSRHVVADTVASAAAAGAASASSVALLLLEQLQAVGTTGSTGGVSLLSEGDWTEIAAAALDASGLPTQHHMARLPDRMLELQAAVLLAALRSALTACSSASLASALGTPMRLFAQLAAAGHSSSGSSSGAGGLTVHLGLLTEKAAPSAAQQLALLADVYGLPDGVAPEAARIAALKLLPSTAASADTGSSPSWLAAALTAACSASAAVRNAALDALLALPDAVGSTWRLAGGFGTSELGELVHALAAQQDMLRGSAGAVRYLLAGSDAASGDGQVGGTGGSGCGTTAQRGKAAATPARRGSQRMNSEEQQCRSSSEQVPVLLRAPARAALDVLLQAALPDLQDDAALLPAAELALAALQLSGDAVQPAAALLQCQLRSLCVPEGSGCVRTSPRNWEQLAACQGGGGVEHAANTLRALRSRVAARLVTMYTPAALRACPELAPRYAALLMLPFDASSSDVLGLSASPHSGSGSWLQEPALAALASTRAAALALLDEQLLTAVVAAGGHTLGQAVFAAALQAHASDGDSSCRAAARNSLARLCISIDMLLPMLERAGHGVEAIEAAAAHAAAAKTPRAKRSKRSSTTATTVGSAEGMEVDGAVPVPAAGPLSAADLDAATAALELLQWHDAVDGRERLAAPLQVLLRRLLPCMGSIAESHVEIAAAEPVEDEAGQPGRSAAGAGPATTISAEAEAEAAAAAVAVAPPSAAGYTAQLSLLLLEQLACAAADAGMPPPVDAALALDAASAAPDGAVRNAALRLLAVLARGAPDAVLAHVLRALAVIQHSSLLLEDSQSQAVAASALAALVPTWLAAGRDSAELWGSLLEALPQLPAPRRPALLGALLRALPQSDGLPVALLLMAHRAADATAAAAKVAAASGTTPGAPADPSRRGSRGAEHGPATPSALMGAATAADGVPPDASNEAQWLPDLMASLCDMVPVPQRLDALAFIMEKVLYSSDGTPLAAHHHAPRLVVTFVTAILKSKPVQQAAGTAEQAAALAEPSLNAVGANGMASDKTVDSIQAGCRSIMRQALLHLQGLSPAASVEGSSLGAIRDARALRREQRAIRAAVAGVYSLLTALEGVQEPAAYLSALVEMSRHDTDTVQRRALRLLTARLMRAAVDVAELEELPAAMRSTSSRTLAAAGLAVCGELPRLLSAPAALSRQLALVAVDAGVRQFGSTLPAGVLTALPHIVGSAADGAAAVRASALACVAACAAAVGPRLLPHLPETAAAVLHAADTACTQLSIYSSSAAGAEAHSTAEESPHGHGSSSKISDGDADETDDAEAAAAEAAGGREEAALQLAAAVTAADALVRGLGPLMSPYLPQLLRLLHTPPVLACSTAGGAAAAARLRGELPRAVPARLLLGPLLEQWEPALAGCSSRAGTGAEPAVALLELVQGFAARLDPAAAASYHEQLAGMLLRALDTRERWLVSEEAAGPPSGGCSLLPAGAAAHGVTALLAGDVSRIEAAALSALGALVMKLSEARFKPLFLRMVDWAAAPSIGAAAAATAAAVSGRGEEEGQAQPAAASSAGLGRSAALLGAVVMLGHRLRAVFAPYQRYYSDVAARLLSGEIVPGCGGGRPRKKKKAKLLRDDSGQGSSGAPTSSAADCAGSSRAALCGWLGRLRAVRAAHIVFLHEPRGETPAAAAEQLERLERLLPLLVLQLTEAPPPAIARALADEPADSALAVPGGPLAALGAAGAAAAEGGMGETAAAAADVLGTAGLGALLAAAAAAGSDAAWKPLHHALLLAARAPGAGPRGRLLVLGGLSRLAALLREEYLLLLPEALPALAELIEDGEPAVEAAAQGVVAQLEGLAGERLEQYLKA